MAMDAAASKNSDGWNSATNWSVAEGSLANFITVESSLSPIDDSLPKSPLILNPPSSDSGPCEIKISFTQKHEVRQVYVRSTARVYEMYWAPDLQSINEYLCTVRCSVAAKDEKSLHASDIEEPVSTHIEGSNGKLAEENLKNSSSASSSEDGWVEVKAPVSLPVDNGSNSQSKINTNAGRILQDLYEATAEISDADPSISLTLRLLLLQNKECVYVDEIYVFADPVELDSTDSRVGCLENPAGSSLMAMFVPTLLQLSKAGINRKEDKSMSDVRAHQRFSKMGSAATNFTNIINKIQEEQKSCLLDQQEVDEANAERAPTSVKVSNLVPDEGTKPDYVAKENNMPYNQLEKTMEQLVSRVGRMEYLFWRFEESMLKPISSIDARLQRVEQQLEALTKKSEGPGVTSTRIFAPEFLCNESDSNSCNDSSDCPSHGALECDKNDSVNAPLHPSLVVIAPEFSNGDDEENDASEQVNDSQKDTLRENDAPEPVEDSPRDEPKHTMSVDDALASALAGFLSSATVGPSKYTETLTVRAPEFPSEEDSSSGDKIASPRVHCEIPNDTESTKDPISTSCKLSLSEIGVEVDNVVLGETAEGIETESQHDHEGEGFNFVESGVISSTVEENQVASTIDDHQTIEKSDKTEASFLISEEFYVPIRFLGDQIDDAPDTPTTQKETVESTDLTNATEVTDRQNTEDILHDYLQLLRSPSVVDFQVPILDVQFISQGNANANFYLEALLTNITEPSSSNHEAPCIEEIQDDTPSSSSKQCSSVPADDGGIQDHATNNHLLFDFDYSKGPAGMGMEAENPENPHTCSKDGLFESLI